MISPWRSHKADPVLQCYSWTSIQWSTELPATIWESPVKELGSPRYSTPNGHGSWFACPESLHCGCAMFSTFVQCFDSRLCYIYTDHIASYFWRIGGHLKAMNLLLPTDPIYSRNGNLGRWELLRAKLPCRALILGAFCSIHNLLPGREYCRFKVDPLDRRTSTRSTTRFCTSRCTYHQQPFETFFVFNAS
jgi:hypothetical protein